MYPKKKPKTDRERFYDAFGKKVGCTPEVYVRRKLAAGMNEEELSRLYDMLAIEIARRASCTAIRYADVLKTPEPKELCMQTYNCFKSLTRFCSNEVNCVALYDNNVEQQVVKCDGADR